MKKFLLKALTVSLGGISLNVVVIILAFVLHQRTIMGIDFSVDPTVDTIIIGNSMLECAIDDTLLSGVLNWAQSGNRVEVSYFKLRKLLQENQGIKYVFFGFGPWIDNDHDCKNRLIGLEQVLPFMSYSELRSLHLAPGAYQYALKVIIMGIRTSYCNTVTLRTFGHYFNLNRNKLDTDILRRDFQAPLACTEVSKFYYRTVELCRDRNVKLIFLQTPIFQKKRFYCDVTWIKNQFFPDVEYWDYGDVKLPNECYGDIDHLNRQGALIFTPVFGEKLELLRARTATTRSGIGENL